MALGEIGPVSGFAKSAAGLSRNPLGTISLFVVLIYAFAALVSVGGSFTPGERIILVYFISIFPFVVISIFAWLVAYHSKDLYSPGDFTNQAHYVEMHLQSKLQAAASLTAAISKDSATASQTQINDVVKAVQNSSTIASEPEGWRRCILWVDDRPDNNRYERKAFEAMGIHFVLSETTEDALRQLKSRRFATVISDMGRREGPQEGYVLLDALRAFDRTTPLFFYASSNAREHKEETARHGGQGCTNDAQELFRMVMNAIVTRKP
ncbi:response regulator [Methylobacterium terrae]|uniref:Response regulator n=1 Tax=Methylobacterium terrae TaxID=2202827 RepID=A0A2U8WHC2_9HYPH|nr:response regulator [Methylobacterium terrae]AWN45459.1 response regulator [Methylobacterium terrae]